MAHLRPLPPTTTPELREDFAIFERIFHGYGVINT